MSLEHKLHNVNEFIHIGINKLYFKMTEVLGPEEDLTGVAVEDDAMNDLQTALSKARKLKQRKKMDPEKKVLQHVREVGMEEGSDDEEPSGSKLPGPNIVLNSTSEFCRTLGDIPTYGQAGNREEDEEELLVCINHSVSGLNDSL